MRKTYLLGVNGNKIYIGNIEVTTRNGYKEFTASFNVGEAFDISKIDEDYKNDYYEELWNCYDAQYKLDLLDDGNKTKDEVIADWSYDDDYRNIIDCSCTDYELNLKNGTTINFESSCCGQHDIREEDDYNNTKFTNKEAVEMILDLWDEYHLKNIEDNKKVEDILNKIYELLEDYEEETDKFDKFIIDNIEV